LNQSQFPARALRLDLLKEVEMKSMRFGWLTVFLVLAVVALVAILGPGTEAQVGGTFQWTRNGEPLTEPMPIPDGANDIRLVWGPDGTFTEAEWTRDGEPFLPIPMPDGANDFHLTLTFPAPIPGQPPGTLQWTRNGKPVGAPIPVPDGANDVRFVWRNGQFVEAYWTRDGERFRGIPIPLGANDFHLRL
jgi:hypothetical protein